MLTLCVMNFPARQLEAWVSFLCVGRHTGKVCKKVRSQQIGDCVLSSMNLCLWGLMCRNV